MTDPSAAEFARFVQEAKEQRALAEARARALATLREALAHAVTWLAYLEKPARRLEHPDYWQGAARGAREDVMAILAQPDDDAATATIAAQSLALATLREALESAGTDLIGFEGYFERRGSMGTVESIRATLKKIDAALAQPADGTAALAGAVLAAGDAAIEAALDVIHAAEQIPVAEPSEWRHITRDTARIARAKVDAYRRARAALRGHGAVEG